ncbi:phycobilisome rod-core linker polypeptide [Brevibacillus reuszeri]|uniref:phycobilisome rod-core linker polypeptide n=1 Tax=Brevibacillus reuszeri TaxID=54915 RepID=UPI003D1A46B1
MKARLKSVQTGKYLQGIFEYDRTSTVLQANGLGFDPMEEYTLLSLDGTDLVHGSKVVIRTGNSYYLHPLNGGGSSVQLSHWGSSEQTFVIERGSPNGGSITSGDIVSLKTEKGKYLTVHSNQKNRLGAEALSAGTNEQFVVEAIETKGAPLNVVAFGDSIVWGQGLYNRDKFTYLTKQWLQVVTERPVELFVFAHSGATIEPSDSNDSFRDKQFAVASEDLTNLWKPIPPGEVNFGYPTIHQQVKSAAVRLPYWHHVSPEMVDLILLDGGINDLGPVTICRPFTSSQWIMDKTAEAGKNAHEMIKTALAKYPNAKIVITDYYQIISQHTSSMLLGFLDWIFSNPSTSSSIPEIAASSQTSSFLPDEGIPDLSPEEMEELYLRELYTKLKEMGAFENLKAKDTIAFGAGKEDQGNLLKAMSENTRLFKDRMNAEMQKIANIFPDRVTVASCRYTDTDAVFAPKSSLWSLSGIQPVDPVWEKRLEDAKKWGKTIGHGLAKTKLASIGHPHVAGAKKYAEGIRLALHRKGWLVETHGLIKRIFQQLLNREATAKELEFFHIQFAQGFTVKDIVRFIGMNDLFRKTIEGLDDRDMVNKIMNAFLGRMPREYDYVRWPYITQSGNWAVTVTEIIESREYHERFGEWKIPSSGRNPVEKGVYVFQYKEREGTVALDRVHEEMNTGTAPLWRHHWTKNWSLVEPFTHRGAHYLLGYKAHSGEVFIDQYTFDYDGTRSLWKHQWTSNWSILQPFPYKDKQYVFGYRERNGDYFIDQINDDMVGTTPIHDGSWTKGWSSVQPFKKGSDVFLFGYRYSDGKYFIDQIKSDMSGFESKCSGKHWTKGWSIVTLFYGADGEVYVFGYRSRDGDYFIDRVNDNLSGTTPVGNGRWTTGWSRISPFYWNGNVYLFGYRSQDGKVFIDKIRDDFQKTENIWSKHWTTGWTTVIPAFMIEE